MSTTNKEAILDEKQVPSAETTGAETTETPSELDRLSETKYDINYNDERFAKVESDKTAALDEIEKTYQGMIDQSDSHYQGLIDASKQWADEQSKLQQEKSDFAIEQIEQQKHQAQKDYTKEQSGAYVDWQKQSNQYGVNAEKQAAAGLANSGYSESSQVAMYTAYQNRVAVARESIEKAFLNYNNAITEARLQNNSMLAEISYNALQQQLELSLQGFQYKNNLLLEKAAQRLEVENMYYNRYQDVLAQINREIALAEQIRQYNETMAEEKRQFDILNPQNSYSGGGGYGGSYYSGGSYSGNTKSKSNDDVAPVTPKKEEPVYVEDDPPKTNNANTTIKPEFYVTQSTGKDSLSNIDRDSLVAAGLPANASAKAIAVALAGGNFKLDTETGTITRNTSTAQQVANAVKNTVINSNITSAAKREEKQAAKKTTIKGTSR